MTRAEIGTYLSGLLPVAELDAFLDLRDHLLTAYRNSDRDIPRSEVGPLLHALAALDADNRELRRRLANTFDMAAAYADLYYDGIRPERPPDRRRTTNSADPVPEGPRRET